MPQGLPAKKQRVLLGGRPAALYSQGNQRRCPYKRLSREAVDACDPLLLLLLSLAALGQPESLRLVPSGLNPEP